MKSVEEGSATPTQFTYDPRRWWALIGFGIAVLIVSLDNAILALAVPSLAESLSPSPTELLWIGDIYSFVIAGLLITMGSLGDRFGRKKLLVIGSVAFAILSVVAAYSPTPEALILSRALMGAAGATLMPSTLSLIRNTFPDPKERTFAIGIWTAMAAFGAGGGPVVGGFLLEHFWWGSVFLVNVPIIVIMLVIGLFSWRESKDPNAGPVDILSIVLSLVGMLAVVWAIKEIAFQGPGFIVGWGALFIGAAILVAFVKRQNSLEKPMINMSLFKNPAFSGAVASQLISIFALIGCTFFLAQLFQMVLGDSPMQAAIKLLPAELAGLIAGPLAAKFIGAWGRRNVIGGGIFVGAVGLFGVASTGGEGVWLISISLLLIGFGIGLALTGAADSVLSAAPPEHAGAASAVGETAYELGAALGIAILGTILGTWYYLNVSIPAGLTESQAAKVHESLPEAIEVSHEVSPSLASEMLTSAHAAFSSGFVVVCVVAGVICLIGSFVAFKVLPSKSEEVQHVAGH
ncbi:MAG: MFS transporter [Candidatus Nanopelagicales bacterium]